MDEIETTEGAPTDTTVTETTPDTSAAIEAPVDSDAAALAAFDQGIAEANGDTAEEGAPVATTAADAAAAAAEAKTSDPEAHAPPAAGGAPLAVDHAKAPEAPKPDANAAPAPSDPETDAAVTELGLKGKAEQRFREMASTIKTQAQEIEPLRAEAARSAEWERLVTETKATPEQFGQSLGYLTYINSGDPAKMGQAFDFLLGELQALGKNIGREVPGLVDPIADHADLAQAVQFGEITRAAALELAQRRTAQNLATQRETVETTQAQQQAEHDRGMAAVAELSNRLKAEDPTFDQKLAFLAPALDGIRRTVHPSQWAAQIEAMYKQVPAIPVATAAPVQPVAPARPPVSAMPLRATGTTTPMQRSLKGASELDAFEMGLQSVGH